MRLDREVLIAACQEYVRGAENAFMPEGAVHQDGVFRLARFYPCCEAVEQKIQELQSIAADGMRYNLAKYPDFPSGVWRSHGRHAIHIAYKYDVSLWLLMNCWQCVRDHNSIPDSVIAEYARKRLMGELGPGVDDGGIAWT